MEFVISDDAPHAYVCCEEDASDLFIINVFFNGFDLKLSNKHNTALNSLMIRAFVIKSNKRISYTREFTEPIVFENFENLINSAIKVWVDKEDHIQIYRLKYDDVSLDSSHISRWNSNLSLMSDILNSEFSREFIDRELLYSEFINNVHFSNEQVL